MLESNNQDVVKEIKQLIYEQYDEGNIDRFGSKIQIFKYPVDLLIFL